MTFTPTDTSNYNSVTGGSASVTVVKATPSVSVWPTGSTITYGAALSTSTLSGGTASVGGSYSWNSGATVPPAPGTAYAVTFTPTDTANYNAVGGSSSLTVNKANASITWPTSATTITYGAALSTSTLSGGSSTPAGSFAWQSPSTVPAAGAPSYTVVFTPTDTANYNTATSPSAKSLTVNKATPTVSTWPTASAITYGQTLASSTLSGGSATVAGSYSWASSGTAPAAGTASQSVTFTPTDTSNYNSVPGGSVSVTVNKANASITWPTSASTITYGQTLASSTLSGGSSTPAGSFAWQSPSTVPAAGAPSYTVVFTPTDTANYNTATSPSAKSLTVNKATPTVSTWPTASAITYGQTLASSTLSGGSASVGGTFSWATPSTVPSVGASSGPHQAVFTPSDTSNYNIVGPGWRVLTVNKATPTVYSWPTAGALTYGQTLASSGLSGGSASVAGSFSWTSSGTACYSTASQSVTFTPTDTTGYNSVAGSSSVTVYAVPTVSISVDSSTISTGGSTVLRWSSTGASYVNIANYGNGQATSGAVTISPASSTTYTAYAYSPVSYASSPASASVTVSAPSPTMSQFASSVDGYFSCDDGCSQTYTQTNSIVIKGVWDSAIVYRPDGGSNSLGANSGSTNQGFETGYAAYSQNGGDCNCWENSSQAYYGSGQWTLAATRNGTTLYWYVTF